MTALITRRDYLILLGLAVGGILTHFALAYPDQVIFDEVHFGKFVTAYCCTGERFFDIHPPHAKLLIAGAAWLGGYRGGFSFENIGQAYTDVPIAAMRIVPAITGVILPLVIFLLLRTLGVGRTLASLGGSLVILDNAVTIQTRVIALDGVLLVATFGSIAMFLAAKQRSGLIRLACFVGAGALAGLAAGTKFTGLSALAVVGIMVVVMLLQRRSPINRRAWIGYGALIVSAAAVVYLAGWVLHFALLPLPGPGDAFHVPTSLLPPHQFNPVNFLRETATLHQIMFDANFNLTAGHPHASPWWSWPFMETPVFYWTSGSAQIYFVGNPVVWWGSTLVFIAALLVSVVQFGQRRPVLTTTLWIPVVGFMIAMLPLVRVPRALFLYHYLTPLLFSLLAAIVWLERYHIRHRWSEAHVRKVATGVVVVALAGWLLMAPLTYGIPLGMSSTGAPRSPALLFWTTQ